MATYEEDMFADVAGSDEEENFEDGMRQNAMEFDAQDKDQDNKLDLEEEATGEAWGGRAFGLYYVCRGTPWRAGPERGGERGVSETISSPASRGRAAAETARGCVCGRARFLCKIVSVNSARNPIPDPRRSRACFRSPFRQM